MTDLSALAATILARYELEPFGIHGVTHWARVLENGRRIAAATGGARLEVVELFALFHDSRRLNEGSDPGHGRRGAALARSLRDRLGLDDGVLALLQEACSRHTVGTRAADPTVAACWDADRLDLERVGIRTDPRRLCTAAARDPRLLAWASRRAAARAVPEEILREWKIGH